VGTKREVLLIYPKTKEAGHKKILTKVRINLGHHLGIVRGKIEIRIRNQVVVEGSVKTLKKDLKGLLEARKNSSAICSIFVRTRSRGKQANLLCGYSF